MVGLRVGLARGCLIAGALLARSVGAEPPAVALSADASASANVPDASADAPSLSLGDSVRGELIGAAELPRRAPGLLRLSLVAGRDSGWGTRALVDMLVRAAHVLQTLPDHANLPLRVGNLSLKRGGQMRWSHSHRSGRDADLMLYVVDEADGQPLAPDAFVKLDAQGRGRMGKGRREQKIRFDAARMWNAVAALLQDGHVQVQHLYLAEPLRRLLLAHARTAGAPEWLVQRARLVVSEPAHAGRHDDHMHLRLYCSRDDRLAGCSDDGPRWPWVQGFDHEVRRQVDTHLAELGELAVDRRSKAVRALTWLQHADRRATEALVWAAVHDVAEVRALALQSLLRAGEPAAFEGLVQAARDVAHTQAVEPLLHAALSLATVDAAPELLAWLAPDCGDLGERLDPEARSRLRSAVAQVVRPWLLEASALPLLGMLDAAEVTTRRSALRSLEFLANRPLRDEDAALHWYAQSGEHGRLRWMIAGFSARGLPVQAPPEVLAPRLIALLNGKDQAAAANAEAWLQRLLVEGPVERVPTTSLLHRSWARWWDLHRQRYRMDLDTEVETARPDAVAVPDGVSGPPRVPAATSLP